MVTSPCDTETVKSLDSHPGSQASRVTARAGVSPSGWSLPSRGPPGARAQDRLASAHAPVPAVPRPLACVVGVHHLQRPDPRAVEFDGRQQVRRGLGDAHDLDERTAGEPDLLAGPGRLGVDDVRGDVVEQRLPAAPAFP